MKRNKKVIDLEMDPTTQEYKPNISKPKYTDENSYERNRMIDRDMVAILDWMKKTNQPNGKKDEEKK